MRQILHRHVLCLGEELARGYAWVALLPRWTAGIPLLLITLVEPHSGLVGLIAAVCAWYAGYVAGADAAERPVCVFNGLLIGLYVTHVWRFSVSAVALAVLGAVFSGWLTVVLGRLAWSLIQLPILSLPFALVAMFTAAAGRSISTLGFNAYVAPPSLFGLRSTSF